MYLVPTFLDLLQPLAAAMTSPSFNNLTTLVTGWVFSPRRTVTGMIVAAQAVGEKHHSALHRFFARASWSLDQLGLIVLGLILALHDAGVTSDRHGSVLLAVDDTLARKRGAKTFGVGMHRDACASSRRTTVVNWGHNWVVLPVLIRLPWLPDHTFALPVLLRLYLNQGAAARHRRAYRTRPQLAVQMLDAVCSAHENKRFHAITDSAYGGQSVLNHLPINCDLTSRLVMDARLYDPPPPRKRVPTASRASAASDWTAPSRCCTVVSNAGADALWQADFDAPGRHLCARPQSARSPAAHRRRRSAGRPAWQAGVLLDGT